jgi:hypothetical protein
MISFLVNNGSADNTGLYPAQRLPASFADIEASAWDNASYNLQYDAQTKAEREVLFDKTDPLVEKLANADPSFDRNKYAGTANRFYSEQKSPALGDRHAINFQEASFAAWSELAEQKGLENPYPTWDSVQVAARELATSKRQRFQEDMAHAGTTSPRMAAFLGESASIMTSPVALMTVVAASPIAIVARPLAAAAVEAAIGAGYEAFTQPQIQSWMQAQGENYSDNQVMASILFSGLASGALGGGISGIYRAFGGTNRAFITGPSGDVSRILNGLEHQADLFGVPEYRIMGPAREGETLEVERWKFTGPVDRRAAIAAQQDLITENNATSSVTRYTEERYDGPWAPDRSLANSAYGASEDVPLPFNTVATQKAMNYHLYATGPYRAQPTPGTAYDTVLYNMDRLRLDDAHTTNIANAVEALHTGKPVPEPSRESLSIGLRIGNTPEHLTTVRKMLDANIPVTLKSKVYRQYLHSVISDWMVWRLKTIVGKVDIPEDGVMLKTTVLPPKSSLEKITTQAVADVEKSRGLGAEINNAKRANINIENQAKNLDPDFEDYAANYQTLLRYAQKNQKAIAEMELKKAALDKKLAEVPENMATFNAQKALYDADVQNVTRVNAAIVARENLAELAAGKMPAALRPLRAELDEVYRNMAAVAAPKTWEDAAEAVIRLNGFDSRFRGTSYDVNTTRNPYLLTDKTRIYSISETKRLNDARQAEMERLDPTMTFDIGDGETITIKQQLDEFKLIEDTLNSMGVCGVGGKKA